MKPAFPLRHAVIAFVLAALAAGAGHSRGQTVPDGHLAIDRAEYLTPEEATAAHVQLAEDMERQFDLAESNPARGYLSWERYNSVPYLSSSHGNRYVSNYANRLASSYGDLGSADGMPPGAVIAKDSFTVVDDGKVLPAPLFVMEKLPPGSDAATADWRYLMILPDSTMFGDSRGAGAERVGFCHSCHERASATDYLFGVPRAHAREQ